MTWWPVLALLAGLGPAALFDPVDARRQVDELQALGLIGTDVAFPQWIANVGAGEQTAPWKGQAALYGTPADAIRRRARWLGFWGRWISVSPEVDDTIERWGPPPPSGVGCSRPCARVG